MIDLIFDGCVSLLLFLADQLGMTYEAVNVWIFVVLWPIFTLVLIVIVIAQEMTIRRLRRDRQSTLRK